MKQALCIVLLLCLMISVQSQEKAERNRKGYAELSMILPASKPGYSERRGFQLGMGWQVMPGLDLGGGLEMNFRWNRAVVPYVQLRGSSHPTKPFGLYYSLSGGKGKIYHDSGPPPRYERKDPGTYRFAQLMVGSRVSHYGLLAVGLRYSFVQLYPNLHIHEGLHFSAQASLMIEGKDRKSPQNIETGIEYLYFYVATGLWWHKRTDLRETLWDGSLSFGFGYNILPYLGLGFSASLLKGIDQMYFSNYLDLVGVGLHVNIPWKNWLLTAESGPILSAAEGFGEDFRYEVFTKSKAFTPYLKLSLGHRFGKKKRFFLFGSYMGSPQMEGKLRTYNYFPREVHKEYIVQISIARFQLGTGIFLSGR